MQKTIIFLGSVSLFIFPLLLSAQDSTIERVLPQQPIKARVTSTNNALQSGSIAVNRETQYQAMSPEELIQEIFLKTGACVTVKNVKVQVYGWDGKKWTNSGRKNRGLAYFHKANSTFPMERGLILSTGDVHEAEGPNSSDSGLSEGIGTSSTRDPDLQAILNKQSGNYSLTNFTVLEFDFVPTGNKMEFNYIFSSEEYPEYVNNKYNDVFGFFVNKVGDEANKKNIALLPETDTGLYEVTVNNINNGYSSSNNTNYNGSGKISNKKYFIKNLKNSPTTEMDGYTKILTAKFENMDPCETYHLKIALGNVGDRKWGSAVFLEANSFDAGNDLVVFGNQIKGMDRIFKNCDLNKLVVNLNNVVTEDTYINIEYEGTAINGTHYTDLDGKPLPIAIMIPAGEISKEIWFKATPDAIDGTYFDAKLFCPCPNSAISASKRITIHEFSSLTSIAKNKACSNGSNGSITITNTGGSNLYEYSIDYGQTWQKENVFSGLPAGTYTIKSRDQGSCHETTIEVAIGSLKAEAGADITQCGNTTFQMKANQPEGTEKGEWSIYGDNPGGITITDPQSHETTVIVPEGKEVTLQWKISNTDCFETDLVTLSSKPASIDYENVYITIDASKVKGELNLIDYVPKVASSSFKWAPIASSTSNCMSSRGVVSCSLLKYNKTHIFKYTVSDECKTNVERNLYMTVTGRK